MYRQKLFKMLISATYLKVIEIGEVDEVLIITGYLYYSCQI